jgi:membrane protease YdiL (CAAX protease family)
MSDEAIVLPEPSTREVQPEARRKKRIRWFELVLLLAVAFGSSMFGSIDLLIFKNQALMSQAHFRWSNGIIHELACLALLGYVLARRKLRIRDLGLRWSLRDILIGLVLNGLGYFAYSAAYIGVHALFHAFLPSALAQITTRQLYSNPSFMLIPFTLINPFFEELIVRAYLMTEIKALTGSWTLAIVTSTVFQATYHLYYGWQTAISFAFVFLIFSLYYARTRKATPLVTAHAFMDIFSMIRLF